MPSVYVKDTRDLSPAAQRLYAGARQTRAGLEVKLHVQAAALRDAVRMLGGFKDNVAVQHDVADGLAARMEAARKRLEREGHPLRPIPRDGC